MRRVVAVYASLLTRPDDCEVLANAPPSTTPVPLLAAIIVLNSHGVAGNEAAVCIEYGGTNG